MKSFFRVALEAILSEFILMGVLVAICTGRKLKASKLLEFFPVYRFNLMALQAIHCSMFPFQLKFCCGMAEF